MADPTTAASGSPMMSVAVSALKAQQARMRVIAENIANSDSVATTPGGDPYRRQAPVFEPAKIGEGVTGVKMTGVRPDQKPFHTEYSPGNPAADAQGNVRYPNVNPLVEMTDMRDAQRSYEANVNVIGATRNMIQRTLAILRNS